MKVAAGITMTHNPFGEDYWASCLRENLTSSSYGEGLETDHNKAPRQSLTRQIFFRFIKQNLKIKAFIGNSENAVLTQIYAALIVYLLLCYLKLLCNLSITLQNCIRILQLNLFRTCTLQALFESPGNLQDNMNVNNQLSLALG